MKYLGTHRNYKRWHIVVGPRNHHYYVVLKKWHKEQFQHQWATGTDRNCKDQGDDYMVFRHHLEERYGVPQGEERREVIAACLPMVMEG